MIPLYLLLVGCIMDPHIIPLKDDVSEVESPADTDVADSDVTNLDTDIKDTVPDPIVNTDDTDVIVDTDVPVPPVYDESTHPSMDADGNPLYPTIPLDFQDTGLEPATTTGTLEDCNIPDDFMLVTYVDIDQDGYGSEDYIDGFPLRGANEYHTLVFTACYTSYQWENGVMYTEDVFQTAKCRTGYPNSGLLHVTDLFRYNSPQHNLHTEPMSGVAIRLYPDIYRNQNGAERFYAALDTINAEGSLFYEMTPQQALTTHRKEFRDQLAFISEVRCASEPWCDGTYKVMANNAGRMELVGFSRDIYLTYSIQGGGDDGDGSAYFTTFWLGDNSSYSQEYHYYEGFTIALGIFDRRFDLDPQTTEGFFTCSWFADDADGDGFSLEDGDCNDGAAWISPAAVEIPNNGVDNNCDGTELCFSDLDGDGYRGVTGTDFVVGIVCPNIAPLQDCDDSDPNKNPGIPEVPCNHIDENCDGQDM